MMTLPFFISEEYFLFVVTLSLYSVDFNPKSIKSREIVGKPYNFRNWHFLNEIILVNPPA
jgi:hypothetical protein